MDNENFERYMDFMLAQQAESAAKLAKIEEIILSLTNGTRDRIKANEHSSSRVPKKAIVKKANDPLAILVAHIERVINEGRYGKS